MDNNNEIYGTQTECEAVKCGMQPVYCEWDMLSEAAGASNLHTPWTMRHQEACSDGESDNKIDCESEVCNKCTNPALQTSQAMCENPNTQNHGVFQLCYGLYRPFEQLHPSLLVHSVLLGLFLSVSDHLGW